MSAASIALNRFGLGARRGEDAPADPKTWLLDQLETFRPRPPVIAAAPTSASAAAELAAYQAERRATRMEARADGMADAKDTGDAMRPVAAAGAPDQPERARPAAPGRRNLRDAYVAAVGARLSAAVATETPFAERLVHFWANHFAVSADKQTVIGLAGTLEFEAVRQHLNGRFADMLGAVERHPAMLLYLDQAQSVGPGSTLGRRVTARGQRRVGLNENLAREIMELHTLGVRTGYGQADVTELARALTGWTVGGLAQGRGRAAQAAPGAFVFAAVIHEPGERRVLGRRYGQTGEAQGQAILADLAAHPATARHVATKLARHFAGDVPPPAMVARLEAAFLRSGGDLPTLHRALVESPEAWSETPAKFRTPWEWGVAAMRALGYREVPAQAAAGLMTQLGQPVWRPGQPIGWDDTAPSWAGPDAVLRRVEQAERFAARAGEVDARALAARLFPGALSPATAQAIARADSPGQGLALLLCSPEMMRR